MVVMYYKMPVEMRSAIVGRYLHKHFVAGL